MSPNNKISITKEQIEDAVKNTDTMFAAAQYLKINERTFKRIASEYGLYSTSLCKVRSSHRYELQDILNGKYPHYSTSHLNKRLIAEGVKKYKCEECGIDTYNGKHISLELDHINGDKFDHSLKNLRFVCPNCHSQTDTYRSKNRRGITSNI